MAEPARKLATIDDLLARPEDRRAELIGGELVEALPPLFDHGLTQTCLGGALSDRFGFGGGGPGGWWIAAEVDVRFGAEVLRPDLAGWRRERMPSPPSSWPVETRPDWVCEILSADESRDRVVKAEVYARGAVPFYWIVSPAARVLEAFELQGEKWLRLGAWTHEQLARVPPFDAVELALASIFTPRE